jgi:multidrug efflux pump subunit AcrA (membrane-fusion protein)
MAATPNAPPETTPANRSLDLGRLRIPERTSHGTPFWVAILFLLIGIAAGFFARPYYEQRKAPPVLHVKSLVISPSTQAGAKRVFQAGGWIEIATPQYPVFISGRIPERITSIAVKEGDAVQPGQLLVTLEEAQRRASLAVAEKRVLTAQKGLELLLAGSRVEEIKAAEARVQAQTELLRYAKAKYDRLKNLEREVLPLEDIDQALSVFNAAQARLLEAQAELEKLKRGSREEDIAIARAELEESKATLDLAKLELTYCQIKAPDGYPVLRVLRVSKRVGEWLNPDKPTPLIELYDPKEMQARVDVTQANLRFVKVGDPVRVTVEAYPGREFPGKVLRLDPLAELAKNTVTVRVRLDNPDSSLFPEMVAQVAFQSETTDEPTGVMLPAEAVREENGAAYVLVNQGGTAKRVEVKISERQAQKMRVTGGLTSGQRVILGDVEGLKDGAKVEEP